MYGTNLDQVGPNMAKMTTQLGQVGRHFAIFCLLREAPMTNLDQVGPALFPTVFRALLIPLLTNIGDVRVKFRKILVSIEFLSAILGP